MKEGAIKFIRKKTKKEKKQANKNKNRVKFNVKARDFKEVENEKQWFIF